MGTVKMRVWDVKHGSAIFIKTPNDRVHVIDLGRGDYSENSNDRSPLETIKNHYKLSTINHLTITHPHKDHIDDILNLDRMGIHVDVLLRPKWLSREDVSGTIRLADQDKFDKYFSLNDGYNVDVTGTSLDVHISSNTGGVKFQHFSTPTLPKNNFNNHSIVTVMTYEGLTVVIPGDNEYDSLEELMQDTGFKTAISNCDILIAPHHGRESAYHSEFVRTANPRLTIISDGSICDTSANSKYTQSSRGWNIWKGYNQQKRYLLTTNSDGEIYIDFGKVANETNPFLRVEIKN
ncbi:ComEC/Rec2 family competence protein [Pedobacter sp. 22163]|uniref:ComEC/Rec2 family competence protein n=1 Tax=Pedobacter sp. 22163 TaxID=3453883 RepID=UPI003F86621E